MYDVIKRIHSASVAGIQKDHTDHRGAATMRSTGDILQVREGEDDARHWLLEFKCDVCGEIVEAWYADTHDLMRDALKQAGIIKQ